MTVLVPAVLVAAVLANLVQLPKVWCNEKTLFSPTPSLFWPFGKAMWRGNIRAYPLEIVTTAVLAVVYVLGHADGHIGSPLLTASLVTLFAMLAGVFAIALFNHPKWLVPPYLRDQPGAMKEWSEALMRSRLVARVRRWLA